MTGTVEDINEISLIIEADLISGVDRWLLESAVIRPVKEAWPKGLLEKAEHDQSHCLVAPLHLNQSGPQQTGDGLRTL